MFSLIVRMGRLLRVVPPILWVALATAALIIGLALYQNHRISTLEGERDSAKEAANLAEQQRDTWMASAAERAASLESARLERTAAEAAVRNLQSRVAAQGARYREQRQRIDAAPGTDDAPVAPVLRDALKGLP